MPAYARFLIGLSAVAALGLGYIHVSGGAARIESMVETAAAARLAEDYAWAQSSASGQAILLTGTPPNAEDAREAERAAHRALGLGGLVTGGVTFVRANFDPPPLPPFSEEWRAEFDGAVLRLSGTAPADAAPALDAEIRASFVGARVDHAAAADRSSAQDWTVAAVIALKALAHLDAGAVSGADGVFRLSGVAPDDAVAAGARATLATIDGRYAGVAEIEIATAPTATTIEEVIARELASPPEDLAACSEEVWELVNAPGFQFASASAVMSDDMRARIVAAAKSLASCPSARIFVSGHTDSTGIEAANLALSAARAQRVAAALVAAGVDPERIEALGRGATEPLAPNATAEGRARNRRIEIRIEAPAEETQ